MTDRIVKFYPALLTALFAFAATAFLAYASLFIVASPSVDVKFAGRVPLNGAVALGEIYKELTAWRCGNSDGPLYLICRFRWVYEIPRQLVEDHVQVDRLMYLAFAPFIATLVAFSRPMFGRHRSKRSSLKLADAFCSMNMPGGLFNGLSGIWVERARMAFGCCPTYSLAALKKPAMYFWWARRVRGKPD